MKNQVIQFIKKYKHGIPMLLYAFIYITWFRYLEQKVNMNSEFKVIHMAIDDYIPFCEVFIVPYYLWFVYVVVAIGYLLFTDKTEYWRSYVFLVTGMTIFLIVSTLWPNGHLLRLDTMPRDNIFTDMVSFLWNSDTPTNLWPSIHVYNSIGAHIAIVRNKAFSDKKGIRIASFILAISIILATVFLKQHSVFDMLTAFLMAAVMYPLVYKYDIVTVVQNSRKRMKNARPQVN